jgi:hypothetical protein
VAAACLRASLRACLSARRSRRRFSRVIFAMVVFFLPFEAMHVPPWVGNDGGPACAGPPVRLGPAA